MKRIHLLMVVAFSLIALVVVYSKQTRQSPQTRPAASSTNSGAEHVKAKKVLVKELSRKVAGITLQDGVFKLAPGYKFVPQDNGTVVVALKATGAVSGTFDCTCSHLAGTPAPSGACKLKQDKDQTSVSCVKDEQNQCSDTCFLEAVVKGTSLRLAMY